MPGTTFDLEDFKAGLNIDATDHSQDDELTLFLAAAAERVEQEVGPIRETSFTERHHPRGGPIILRRLPVIAIDSLTVAGLAWAPELFDVDPETGIVYGVNGSRLNFYGHQRRGEPVIVTYRAGRTIVPESILRALVIIGEHLWQTQRGWASNAPDVNGEFGSNQPAAPMGFALPNRAVQLLEPYRLPEV